MCQQKDEHMLILRINAVCSSRVNAPSDPLALALQAQFDNIVSQYDVVRGLQLCGAALVTSGNKKALASPLNIATGDRPGVVARITEMRALSRRGHGVRGRKGFR
jgi:hypothetical protein